MVGKSFTRSAFGRVGVERQNLLGLCLADLPPFVAQALAHGHPKVGGVDQLHLTLPFCRFAIAQHPDVGGDAGVVEELLRQGNERVEQVVLQHETPDLALAAAGVAGEEGRPVHDDGHAAAAGVGRLHVGDHVQQKEQLAIADARQAGGKAAAGRGGRRGHRILVPLPILAVGRIGDQIVEIAPGVAILGQRAAEEDVVGVATVGRLDEEV